MRGDDSPARQCLSSDGFPLGTIVGIHRDPVSNAARWAVLATDERPPHHLFVPVQAAVPRQDGLYAPYAAAHVRSAPVVVDHTRMSVAEETALMQHYGLAPAPAGHDDKAGQDRPVWMTRSEEQLAITALEWRPYSRVHIRRVVRSEEVTHVITVRHEELVVEDEPVTAVERLEVAFGLVPQTAHDDIEMVLHREEVVVQTRIVPYERVRIRTVRAPSPWLLEDTLRKERIDVQREPAGRSPEV